MTETYLALDRASIRTFSPEGHLHVGLTPISKAAVNGYLGREIPGWQDLGLDAERVYQLYRAPDELEKAAGTSDGKPLLLGHNPVSAEDHDHERTVGAVKAPVWKPPYLMAALDVWSGGAIRQIETGAAKELSSGYRYRPDMTPGIAPDGTRFDGVMRDLVFNHVALVEKGRAGPDVVVGDASITVSMEIVSMAAKPALSRPAFAARVALDAYLKPKLAKGVALDSASFVSGITGKTYRAQLPAIIANIKTKTAGKLATDASVDDVEEVMEAIAPILEAEEDDETAVAADAEKDEDDEDEDKKSKKKDDDVKAAQDAALAAATKGMVSKVAMDEAIASAVKVATDAATRNQREIRDAERAVEPWVGHLAMSFDSAPDVYRTALKALKVEGADKLHADALFPVLQAQPKPGDKPSFRPEHDFAQDAASVESYDKLFPHANRLK